MIPRGNTNAVERRRLAVLLLVAVVAWCSAGSAMAMASSHGCGGVEAAGQVCAQPGMPETPPAALAPASPPDGRIAGPPARLPSVSSPRVASRDVPTPARPRGPPRLLA
jgi:hypothetical protein